MPAVTVQPIEKTLTYIPGFDYVSKGGLPRGRTTLVAGSSGSAKSVFGCHFLAGGILHAQESGVFVTFEETPLDIRRNMQGFGWDIAAWESNNLWAFVDGTGTYSEETVINGDYDLDALIARVEYAIKRVNAKRVIIDSMSTVLAQLPNPTIVRHELFRLISALKSMDVTAIVTAERSDDFTSVSRFEVEEFVSDNVIILRNALDGDRRRRTIEVLKFRGTDHAKGEFPFSVMPNSGVEVIPLAAIEMTRESSTQRIPSGVPALDAMCGGGFLEGAVILVSGATGSGKTLVGMKFVATGVEAQDQRTALFTFEESRSQLYRNAKGWGIDFAAMEQNGMLRVMAEYPESANLEDHLIKMKRIILEFQPSRVVVDSISALENIATPRSFREFIIGLTAFLREQGITVLYTSNPANLLGSSISEGYISTITDTIIMMRYVETFGEMQRVLTVLKMRGSQHDKRIRQFTIDTGGINIGPALRNVSGILSGNFVYTGSADLERIHGPFASDQS